MAEANLLYWATALLELCFAFICRFIAQAGKQPPFPIPKIRFVQAGVAVVHQAAKGGTTCNPSSLHRTYLLEEFINNPESEFVKFVHNGDAVHLLADNDPLYALAEFLCFTQHVQYTKSGGLIFISDYQGTEHLLTDPQIMPAPEVKTKEGKYIFGEGNVGSAFVRNKYCKWFELEPLHT